MKSKNQIIEHYIDDKGIYHIILDNKEMLQIVLDIEKAQIVMSTEKNVFQGPIQYLKIE